MASAELSRASEEGRRLPAALRAECFQRREFQEGLLEADSLEDLPGKWQAALLKAKQSRPKLRVVADNQSRQGCQRAEREPGEEGRAVEGAPSTRLVEFVKKENLFHRLPIHRSRVDRVFYSATKHYGVWFMKVRMNLPDAVIAAQAGWSERSVTKMVETYGHATDDRRLDEIDAAFQTQIQTQASPIPLREPS